MGAAACASAMTLTAYSAYALAPEYYIEEITDFTGNGCTNVDDTNEITWSLTQALNADGQNGSRWMNADSWPQDWWEQCSAIYGSGGGDKWWADTARLAVYAGHGYVGGLYFGYPHAGQCLSDLGSNMRLGQMSGDESGYAMYLTSCTMHPDYWVSDVNHQWVFQQFGFANPSLIGEDYAGDFYDATNVYSNKDAFLDEFEDRPGWFTGDNSPVVITKSTTQTDALNRHNGSRFAYGDPFWETISGGAICGNQPPGFHWYYSWRDHGVCS
jgi:hypothetical protein